MSKKGVIQIIDSLNAGGAEVLAVNIANALSRSDYNSHICTTREEGVLKENVKSEVGYLFLEKKKVFDFKSINKIRIYIIRNNISIIHAHSTSYFFAFLVKLILPRVKLIWHDHYGKSQDLHLRKLFPLKICSFFFDSIISVNTELKEWAQKKILCKKVYFLNNFPMFVNTKTTTKLFGKKGKRIVCLAAFREQKDHLNLLNAFKIVLKTNSDYTLHLVGEIHNDEYSNKIKNFVKEEKLLDSVFFYGVCSDIKNILNQCDIGVLSSKSEGLPIALLEYGLANLPVLTTDVGECKKVINHHKAIVVSKRSDIFAKALIKIIEDDFLRNEISKALHLNVLLKFSKENFMLKIKKMYTTND
jgi:glycosyltransferase involved in cell wall biosynthesis